MGVVGVAEGHRPAVACEIGTGGRRQATTDRNRKGSVASPAKRKKAIGRGKQSIHTSRSHRRNVEVEIDR